MSVENEPGSPDEILCDELVEVITDYIEATMSSSERKRFEAHLEDCPWCVNYLDQMRETISALGQLSSEAISPGSRRELVEAFRGWRDR